MMPDVAAVVINKHLERPKKGMPPEWRKDFHMRSHGLKKLQNTLKLAMTRVKEEPLAVVRGVCVAVCASLASVFVVKRWREGGEEEEEEWEWVEMTPWEEMVDRLQSIVPGFKRAE